MPRTKKTETEEKKADGSMEDKKKKLAEKAKEIEGKIEKAEEFPDTDIGIDIFSEQNKKQIEKDEKKIEEEVKKIKTSGTLVPIDDYVKAGVYIGTKAITPNMRKFVYRRRADGVAVINTNIVDQKIREAAKFLSGYAPGDVIVVCKREAGWRAVKLFGELTGIRVFTKKYPAGIITNTSLPDFFEAELVFICDPWLDKNALNDALNIKKKVLGICDTNNLDNGLDAVIPANNKSNKSLGIIFYILAKEYMEARKIDNKLPGMEEFIGEKLEEIPMKTRKSRKAESEKKKDTEKIESILKLDKEERE